MKFYRLEHKETKGGVYRGSNSLNPSVDPSRHPLPHNDSKLVREGIDKIFKKYYDGSEDCYFDGCDYIFGFESADQYRSWFYRDEVLTSAKREGFALNLYETENFFCGNTQMVAEKETLVLVGECDIFSGELINCLKEKSAPKRSLKRKTK